MWGDDQTWGDNWTWGDDQTWGDNQTLVDAWTSGDRGSNNRNIFMSIPLIHRLLIIAKKHQFSSSESGWNCCEIGGGGFSIFGDSSQHEWSFLPFFWWLPLLLHQKLRCSNNKMTLVCPHNDIWSRGNQHIILITIKGPANILGHIHDAWSINVIVGKTH